MSQKTKILGRMKLCGSISPIEALNEIGCFQLAARISELKAEGHCITTDTQKGYAVYTLEPTNDFFNCEV